MYYFLLVGAGRETLKRPIFKFSLFIAWLDRIKTGATRLRCLSWKNNRVVELIISANIIAPHGQGEDDRCEKISQHLIQTAKGMMLPA